MKNKNGINKIIEVSSALALSVGLVYGLIILSKNIFFKYVIQEPEVQIIAVLAATGLLGNVLGFVLEKIVKDFVDQHLGEQIKILVDKEFEQASSIEKEEKDREAIIEYQDKPEFDTVIVPVQNTADAVKKNLSYKCPTSYSFKEGLKYIAFYKNKAIIGYGEITSRYNEPVMGEKVFNIARFVPTEIKHNKSGAFVQSKMYCNIEKLKRARTTEEIREDI